MKTSCLINNFNYGRFVVEAVNSAKNQSVAFDEIIVVDDCSTDESAQILRENFANDQQVKLILKDKNEGQLSCFNDGSSAAIGEIIFFLDSDDLYQPNYLEEALTFYKEHKDCEFLFCNHENFGEFAPPQNLTEKEQDLIHNYGYSVAAVWYMRRWIGGPTSTISLRKHILNKILPIPYLEDWKSRADDCLVYGASIAGAKKFFINKPLVKYRFHGNNNLQGQVKTSLSGNLYEYKRDLSFDRLFSFFYNKIGYHRELAEYVDREFKTIEKPGFSDLVLYIKVLLISKLGNYKKLKGIMALLIAFYLKN